MTTGTAKMVNNWGLEKGQDDGFQPPELIPWYIVGEVDGRVVTLRIDAPAKGNFMSRGVEYELGEPNPDYEAKYPGAKERMKAKFK